MLSPLKVAFFGSDRFSISCLQPLLPLLRKNGGPIAHLDVITRYPKKSGRGLTNLKDVPIAAFAHENQLPLLRADKKADFASLANLTYDLCIAVSYGRLIPSTFLQSVKYGGLNVHPSLLPRHSGPAPLQRALLEGDSVTGVTVQTLHPTEFDKGDILLMQKYTVHPTETLETLTAALSKRGGQLLKTAVERRLFDRARPDFSVVQPSLPYTYAAKVTKDDCKILWSRERTSDIMRKQATLGPLFTFKMSLPKKANKKPALKRVVLSQLRPFQPAHPVDDLVVGGFALDGDNMYIKTLDGFVSPSSLSTEGIGSETGAKFVHTLSKKFNHTEPSFETQT